MGKVNFKMLTIIPLIIRWINTIAFLVVENTLRYTKPRAILCIVIAASVIRWDRSISRKSWAFFRKNTWVNWSIRKKRKTQKRENMKIVTTSIAFLEKKNTFVMKSSLKYLLYPPLLIFLHHKNFKKGYILKQKISYLKLFGINFHR